MREEMQRLKVGVCVAEAVPAAGELAPAGDAAPVDKGAGGQPGAARPVVAARRLSSPDQPLLDALVEPFDARPRNTGRFLTMQRRRRRKLTTRTLVADCALLDDVHHGLVQVSPLPSVPVRICCKIVFFYLKLFNFFFH